MFVATPIKTNSIHLSDVVDLAALQRIQDTFAKAMGVAAVTVDRQGIPFTRDSNFRRICLMIRSTDAGLKRCMLCDAEGGMEARNRGAPYTYTCRGGMMDIAAPIIIHGEYLGSVLCGQVVPSSAREEFLDGVIARNSQLNLSLDEVKKAAQEIPSLPLDRVDAAGEMLFQMANYIVEMGVANLTQKRLLKEVENRVALETALRDSQMRMLQSQIAPHFLFNALGLIGYTAMQENAHQTEDITYSLSDLLRYSLRSSLTAPVTLGQELEIIHNYLAIQKLRFHSRLIVQVDVDPALNSMLVPCMVLQPLVENAVIHAVEPLTRPVTVKISARRTDKGLLLEVCDDGVGMDPVVRASLFNGTIPANSKRPSQGLRNVIRRLELEYGDRFDLQIDSAIGHGTRICLHLPMIGA